MEQIGSGELESGRLCDGEGGGTIRGALVSQAPDRQIEKWIPFGDGEDRAQTTVIREVNSQGGEKELSAAASLFGEAGDVGCHPLPDQRDGEGIDDQQISCGEISGSKACATARMAVQSIRVSASSSSGLVAKPRSPRTSPTLCGDWPATACCRRADHSWSTRPVTTIL